MFELLFFCMRQRKMGNTNTNTVFSNGVEYLANQDLNRVWKMKQNNLSPKFTTVLEDIIKVK